MAAPASPHPGQARAPGPELSRNVVILLGARTSMSVARAVAGVITALYLAAEGFSGVEIGELFLAVTLSSALLTTVIGLSADRVGNRAFLVAIPLLTALASVVFGFSRSVPVLFVFAALGSFGRGAGAGSGSVGPYRPAEASLATASVSDAQRTTLFGRLTFASTLGALIGGLLATLAQPGHATGEAAMIAYRPAFIAAAALAAIAGIAALWLHEERAPRVPSSSTQTRRERQPLRSLLPRRSWPMLWRFWITNSINGAAIGIIGPFMSYWFARRYGVGPGTIGILFAIVNAVSLSSTLLAAPLAKRIGTVRTIVAVRVVTGALLVPMALAPTFAAAGGIYILRMIAQRLGLPLRQSFVQGVSHKDEQASMAALANLPAQGTMAGSQVLAGYLFDEVGLAVPFELAAGFQLLNALSYGILFGRIKPVEERAELAEHEEVV